MPPPLESPLPPLESHLPPLPLPLSLPLSLPLPLPPPSQHQAACPELAMPAASRNRSKTFLAANARPTSPLGSPDSWPKTRRSDCGTSVWRGLMSVMSASSTWSVAVHLTLAFGFPGTRLSKVHPAIHVPLYLHSNFWPETHCFLEVVSRKTRITSASFSMASTNSRVVASRWASEILTVVTSWSTCSGLTITCRTRSPCCARANSRPWRALRRAAPSPKSATTDPKASTPQHAARATRQQASTRFSALQPACAGIVSLSRPSLSEFRSLSSSARTAWLAASTPPFAKASAKRRRRAAPRRWASWPRTRSASVSSGVGFARTSWA
mmetsp:Transcript_40546/g.86291  ORF Transcript_40546/g.86291 Transcript_40546/m.86291 type:complete len:325 (-) Transcript_40546:129-1103(-)